MARWPDFNSREVQLSSPTARRGTRATKGPCSLAPGRSCPGESCAYREIPGPLWLGVRHCGDHVQNSIPVTSRDVALHTIGPVRRNWVGSELSPRERDSGTRAA